MSLLGGEYAFYATELRRGFDVGELMCLAFCNSSARVLSVSGVPVTGSVSERANLALLAPSDSRGIAWGDSFGEVVK